MHVGFMPVKTDSQIETLASVAGQIWHEYYPGIITPEQVRYMVDKFQSAEAIARQIRDDGYEYCLVTTGEGIMGYLALKAETERMLLSKLYLKKEHRGQGFFSAMLAFAERSAAEKGIKILYLTVNRHNENAIAVYRKKGFGIVNEQAAHIGGGFIMDDYIMEKRL